MVGESASPPRSRLHRESGSRLPQSKAAGPQEDGARDASLRSGPGVFRMRRKGGLMMKVPACLEKRPLLAGPLGERSLPAEDFRLQAICMER